MKPHSPSPSSEATTGKAALKLSPPPGVPKVVQASFLLWHRRRRGCTGNYHPRFRRVGHGLGLWQRRGSRPHRCDLQRGYQGDRLHAGGLHDHTDASGKDRPQTLAVLLWQDRDSLLVLPELPDSGLIRVQHLSEPSAA